MRVNQVVLCAALGLILGSPSAGLAQYGATVSGMFGQRSMGNTLTPRPRSFGAGGIITDPGGGFLGRGRVGGMQFNALPWQYPNTGKRPAPLIPPPPRWEAALERLTETSAGLPSQPQAALSEPPRAPSPSDATQGRQPDANSAPSGPERLLPSPTREKVPSGSTATPAGLPSTPEMAGAARSPLVARAYPGAPPSADPAARVADRILRTDRINKRSPITVELRDQTAILRGRVATEHDRHLAEALARLEPGVGRVRNELTVAAPAGVPPATSSGR